MPALPPVQGVVRLRLIGTTSGQPWNAVQHATYTGTPPTDTQCRDIGTAVGTAWNEALALIHSTTVALVNVEVTDLSDPTAGVGFASTAHSGLKSAAAILPLNAALVASYKIHVRYRGGHPRTYWPAGVAADVNSGRLWVDAFRTQAQAACTDYVGNINQISAGAGLLTFCTVSYYLGKDAQDRPLLRETPIVYPVASVSVHTRMDTMRSRLGKENA
jgi:hypothetical protein